MMLRHALRTVEQIGKTNMDSLGANYFLILFYDLASTEKETIERNT